MSSKSGKQNLLDKLKARVFSNKWSVVIIVTVLVLSNARDIYEDAEFFYLKFFAGGKLPKDTLKEKAINLSRDLLEFIEERRNFEPEFISDEWDDSVNRIIKYNGDTYEMYLQKYYPEVSEIIIDFKKYGISDYIVEMYSRHPTGDLAVQQIALALIDMANQL